MVGRETHAQGEAEEEDKLLELLNHAKVHTGTRVELMALLTLVYIISNAVQFAVFFSLGKSASARLCLVLKRFRHKCCVRISVVHFV